MRTHIHTVAHLWVRYEVDIFRLCTRLLNKGKKSAMHKAGMSVRGKIVKDDDVVIESFEDYIVSWPLKDLE